MKYELKTPIFKDNYARNLLKSRGVEDYDSFINPTKEFLSDPLDLNNVLKGIELLLKHIRSNGKIIVVVD